MTRNIFLVGPMGVGKSTIGKYLATEMKMDFYDTDRIIEDKAGVSVSWIFDVEGELGFQEREEKILEEITKKNGIVLATGGNIVSSKKSRILLSSRGEVVYLRLNIHTQLERTKKDSRRPQLSAKDNLFRTLQDLQDQLTPWYYDIADHVFDTKDLSPKNVACSIKEMLAND